MKEQERFSKEFKKLCKQNTTLNINVETGYIYDSIINTLDNDNVILFIKSLEQEFEDWDVAEKLFQYFANEMLKYDENLNSEYPDPLENKTKILITKLYNKFCKK